MAIGPTRALLASHFHTSLARSTKELSKQGLWAVIFLVFVLGLFVSLPIAVGLFMGGLALAKSLPAENAIIAGGALLALPVFIGGIMGGLLGGAKKLSWEQYRAFPIRRLQLFSAELVAGIGDVLVLGLALGLLSLMAGMAVGQPKLLSALPFVYLECLLLMLVLQLFLGSLAQRLAKRLKVLVFGLLGIVWLGSMLLGQVASKQQIHPSPELAEKARLLADGAFKALEALPTTWAMRGLNAAGEGQWMKALLLQLYPLALIVLIGWGAMHLLEREQEALAPVEEKGEDKLWSFRSAPDGISRLQLRTLLSSHHGKFGFVMPLMTVVFLRGPMAHMSGTAFWAIPGSFAYLALFGNQFQFNQFGLDGHGVKGLFLLPISGRQLLKGKLQGYALYQGLQVVVLLALMIPLFRPHPLELVAALGLGACFFLAQNAVGAFTSAWMPRRIDRASLKNNQMPLPLVLIGMGVSLGCSLIFGGAYALLKWQAPTFLAPGMLILATASWLIHRVFMPDAAAYLERRREAIVDAMG